MRDDQTSAVRTESTQSASPIPEDQLVSPLVGRVGFCDDYSVLLWEWEHRYAECATLWKADGKTL